MKCLVNTILVNIGEHTVFQFKKASTLKGMVLFVWWIYTFGWLAVQLISSKVGFVRCFGFLNLRSRPSTGDSASQLVWEKHNVTQRSWERWSGNRKCGHPSLGWDTCNPDPDKEEITDGWMLTNYILNVKKRQEWKAFQVINKKRPHTCITLALCKTINYESKQNTYIIPQILSCKATSQQSSEALWHEGQSRHTWNVHIQLEPLCLGWKEVLNIPQRMWLWGSQILHQSCSVYKCGWTKYL